MQPIFKSAVVDVGDSPCAASCQQHGSPHRLRCSSGLRQCMSYERFPLSVARKHDAHKLSIYRSLVLDLRGGYMVK